MTERVHRTVGEVLGRVLSGVSPAPGVTTSLVDAAGCVLARDVVVTAPLPPEPRAAMDGVAVRSRDVAGATMATPTQLRLDGSSLAGRGDRRPLAAGAAREIATGAPLPEGADAVVRVEDLQRSDGIVAVRTAVVPGDDVRPAGDDAEVGHVLVAAGRRLDAGALAGLAGAGVTEVRVVPPPCVLVLPTGDEVVAGTTPDAVGPMLAHLLGRDGARIEVAPPVPDDPAVIADTVTSAARTHDLVITVGGASVGPRDHAGELVAGLPTGESVSLAMRPGRPFAWGRTPEGVPVLCLPGSPLAALAATIVLVRPVVARLAHREPAGPIRLSLAAPIVGDPRRRSLVPAAVAQGHVRPVAGRGAADLARLAATSGLIDVPAGTDRVDAGAPVDVWVLP